MWNEAFKTGIMILVILREYIFEIASNKNEVIFILFCVNDARLVVNIVIIGEMIMDNKKKKRRTVGIILMWIGGILTALTFVGVLVLSCVPGLFVGYLKSSEEETRQTYLKDGCYEFEATSWPVVVEEYETGKDLHIYVKPEFYDSYDQKDHEYLGVMTDTNEDTNIDVYPEMESTYIFYKECRTEIVTLPEDLAKRQIAPEADITIVDLEDVEGFVLNHRDENMQSWISYGMLTFSFVYIIPFILFLAGVIVFVVNKEKNNF